ncbi:hypothetical protein [Haloprofundus salilacus]|uniref:hypothetical protein n=1 Tax=Haloprofundus salilacus TaxID=2876190 RepID=UPI001CCB877C|nr:hypothetical protein [Haloprofundus salilacus]
MSAEMETQNHLRECRRNLPNSLDGEKVVFGFDGVVDRVRRVVAKRTGPEEYEIMGLMSDFSTRIGDSAGMKTSLSIEWKNNGMRAGGHTSHLGRAMEQLGCKPTLIGTFGNPPVETFTREYERADLLSVGHHATTDAVEFNDGKILLSDSGILASLDWDTICNEVGLNTLASRIDRTQVLGIGYWATVLQIPTILEGLRTELWPRLRDPPERIIFDPADIRRLSKPTLESGLEAIERLNETVPITVSSNRVETLRIADLFDDADELSLTDAAQTAREGLNVSKFVVHTVHEAISITADGIDRVEIPHVEEPTLTTSAGDHFNAGLVLGRIAGLNDGAQLIAGSAVAGYFVRNAAPPTFEEFTSYLDEYEAMFPESQATE